VNLQVRQGSKMLRGAEADSQSSEEREGICLGKDQRDFGGVCCKLE